MFCPIPFPIVDEVEKIACKDAKRSLESGFRSLRMGTGVIIDLPIGSVEGPYDLPAFGMDHDGSRAAKRGMHAQLRHTPSPYIGSCRDRKRTTGKRYASPNIGGTAIGSARTNTKELPAFVYAQIGNRFSSSIYYKDRPSRNDLNIHCHRLRGCARQHNGHEDAFSGEELHGRCFAERPKLSDPAHEGVRLQPGRSCRVRCSA